MRERERERERERKKEREGGTFCLSSKFLIQYMKYKNVCIQFKIINSITITHIGSNLNR